MGTVVASIRGRTTRLLPPGTGYVTRWESGAAFPGLPQNVDPAVGSAVLWGAAAALGSFFLKARVKPLTAGAIGAALGYFFAPKVAKAAAPPMVAAPPGGMGGIGGAPYPELEDLGLLSDTPDLGFALTTAYDIIPPQGAIKGKQIIAQDLLGVTLRGCGAGMVWDKNWEKCLLKAHECAPPGWSYLGDTPQHPAGCYTTAGKYLQDFGGWNASLECPPPTDDYKWHRVNTATSQPTADPATWRWDSTCEKAWFPAEVQSFQEDEIYVVTEQGEEAITGEPKKPPAGTYGGRL